MIMNNNDRRINFGNLLRVEKLYSWKSARGSVTIQGADNYDLRYCSKDFVRIRREMGHLKPAAVKKIRCTEKKRFSAF